MQSRKQWSDIFKLVKERRCQPISLYLGKISFKNEEEGFPGDTVVKNLPANAGDTGLSPGPGRSHMLQNN